MMINKIKSLIRKSLKPIWYIKNTIFPFTRKEMLPISYIEVLIDGYANSFFGYYDISPFNSVDTRQVIFHLNNANPEKVGSVSIPTNIAIYNTATKKATIIGSTNAWNWQQGARLQWIDSSRIIYNNCNNDGTRLHSVIYDQLNDTSQIINSPISVIYNSEFGLTMSYERLTNFTEYGYNGLSYHDSEIGINQINLESGKITSLINFESVDSLINDTKTKSHINHILVAPNNKKFIFIFRYRNSQNKRRDVLLKYEFESQQITIIKTGGIISHYNWINTSEIVMWGIINDIAGYYIVNTNDSHHRILKQSGKDGHPTMISENKLISDTYPDMIASQQTLFVLNIENGLDKIILRINHPLQYLIDCRCDLHPSISADKKEFQIDTRRAKNRVLGIGKIEN